MADVMEVEQLLARYAVGMTQDDIDAVMDVFTPDGTYRAFGSTYTLTDFPALVAAAPKGLYLTGTPLLDLDGEAGTGSGSQTLCFVEQTTHEMRIGWYARHLPPHRGRVAPAHQGHDVPPAQRRPRLGQAARPDPAAALG